MRKILLVCGLNLLITAVGFAQEMPKFEIFAGGSYLRFHSDGADISTLTGHTGDYYARNINFNLYGWNTSVTENMNNWFGGEMDFSGLYGKPTSPALSSFVTSASPGVSANISTNMYTFMFGPRIRFPRLGRVVPFAHVLAGGVRFDGTYGANQLTSSNGGVSSTFSDSQTAFALSPGVGIDVNVANNLAVRLFQLDYLMTRLYGRRQDNARVSVGILFHIGH
jgi:opacity protein-like surface antigen